jgi:hypothetical protein
MITIKLNLVASKSTQRKSTNKALKKKSKVVERESRLRSWLDESSDRTPWNALLKARWEMDGNIKSSNSLEDLPVPTLPKAP